MAHTQQVGVVTTVLAQVALAKRRFVGFDGALAAAGAKALGVVEIATDAGSQAPVNLNGVLLVEAGAAIAAKAAVEVDALGRVVTQSTGVINGYTMDAAVQAGDIIRVARV